LLLPDRGFAIRFKPYVMPDFMDVNTITYLVFSALRAVESVAAAAVPSSTSARSGLRHFDVVAIRVSVLILFLGGLILTQLKVTVKVQCAVTL
jgi:hypothetical protein